MEKQLKVSTVTNQSEGHAQATSIKTQLVKLDLIRCDCGTQSRAALNDETVVEYAERMLEGDKFPPAVVFFDGNHYYLADGFHRVMAAIRNEFRDFECEVRIGTKSDALKFSIGANTVHGLKRTNADKRRSVELALSEWPNMSDRAIADICAVSFMLVGDVRRAQVQESCTCESEIRCGRDGKQYPVKQTAMPQTAAEPQNVSSKERVEEQKPEPTLMSAFETPLATHTPDEHKALWARIHADLKTELEYHLNLVRADAEYLLEKSRDSFIEAGELKDCGTQLRFTAKKVEAMIEHLIFLSQN